MYFRNSGFTLIELIITILVMSILLGIAVPSYMSFKEDNALLGAAQAVYSDMQFARSEAIKRDVNNIKLRIFSTGTNWCYQLTDISDNGVCGECGDKDCDIHNDEIVRGVSSGSTSFPNVVLQTPSSAADLTFFSHPTTLQTTTSVVFSYGASGKQISVQLLPLGRVLMCTPSGASGVSGVELCPGS